MQRSEWKEIWELRAQLYAFLGNSLLASMTDKTAAGLDPTFWESFPLEPANAQMEEALAGLCAYVASAPVDRAEAVQAAAVEYAGLFLGPGAPKAPLWESLHREGGKYLFGQPTFDMRETFRAHKLALSDDAHQLEDHLGVELLFLAAVSGRFAALPEGPGATDVAEQREFIAQHPLSWIGRLHQLASEHAPNGFYPALIELAWGVLIWDEELLEEYEHLCA